MLSVSVSSGVDRRMCEVDVSHLYNVIVKLSAEVPVLPNPCYSLALNFCGENLPFGVKMTSELKPFFLKRKSVLCFCAECRMLAKDRGLCLKIAVRRNTAHPFYILPLNCTQRLRIRNFSTV